MVRWSTMRKVSRVTRPPPECGQKSQQRRLDFPSLGHSCFSQFCDWIEVQIPVSFQQFPNPKNSTNPSSRNGQARR